MSFNQLRSPRAVAPARRPRNDRPDHRFRPSALEDLEAKAVPAVIDPFFAFSQGYVQINGLFPDASPPTTETSTFTLTAAGINAVKGGDTIQVGLASYLEFGSFPDLSKQLLYDSATDTLSFTHQSTTLTVAVATDGYCTQVDAFLGPVVTQFAPGSVPGNNGYETPQLGRRIFAGVILHDGVPINIVGIPPDDVCPPMVNTSGLTIGYWKTHDFSSLINPNTTLSSLGFNLPSSLAGTTLLSALSLQGGPTLDDKIALLVKQAAGSYLNAMAFGVSNFGFSPTDVVHVCNAAISTGDVNLICSLQALLDTMNSVEGPIALPYPNLNKK